MWKSLQKVWDKMEDKIINDEKPTFHGETKPKKLATIVELEEPLDLFPNEEENDKTS